MRPGLTMSTVRGSALVLNLLLLLQLAHARATNQTGATNQTSANNSNGRWGALASYLRLLLQLAHGNSTVLDSNTLHDMNQHGQDLTGVIPAFAAAAGS